MELGQPPGVELHDTAVVRHETVDLALDVARLRVDGGAESLLHQRRQLFDQRLVAGLELGAVLEGSVAPVALVPPKVAFEWQTEAAELAEHGDAVRVEREH